MPKAILEFTLPEDEGRFQIAGKAIDWAFSVYDLDEYLRAKIKYSDIKESERKIFQMVRDEIHAILANHDLNLDSLDI